MKIRNIEDVDIKKEAGPGETILYLNYIKYWTRMLLSKFNYADEAERDAQAEQADESRMNEAVTDCLSDISFYYAGDGHYDPFDMIGNLEVLQHHIQTIGEKKESCRELSDNLIQAIDKVKECKIAINAEDGKKSYGFLKKSETYLESAFFDADSQNLKNYRDAVRNAVSSQETRAGSLKLIPSGTSIPEMLIFMKSLKTLNCSSAYAGIFSGLRDLYHDYKNHDLRGRREILDRIEALRQEAVNYCDARRVRYDQKNMSQEKSRDYAYLRFKAVEAVSGCLFTLYSKLLRAGEVDDEKELREKRLEDLKSVFTTEGHVMTPKRINAEIHTYKEMENLTGITRYIDHLADLNGEGKSGIDSIPAALTLLEAVKSPNYNSASYNDLVFRVSVLNKDYAAKKDPNVIKNDIGKIVDRINEYRKHVASSNGANDVYRVNKAKAVDLLHKLIRTNFCELLNETDSIDEDTILSAGKAKKASLAKGVKNAAPEKEKESADLKEAGKKKPAGVHKMSERELEILKKRRVSDQQIDKLLKHEMSEQELEKLKQELAETKKEIKKKKLEDDKKEYTEEELTEIDRKNRSRIYDGLKQFDFGEPPVL